MTAATVRSGQCHPSSAPPTVPGHAFQLAYLVLYLAVPTLDPLMDISSPGQPLPFFSISPRESGTIITRSQKIKGKFFLKALLMFHCHFHCPGSSFVQGLGISLVGPNPGSFPTAGQQDRTDLPESESFFPPPLPLLAPSPREITLKGPNGTMSSSLPLSPPSLPLFLFPFFFY